VAVVASEHRLRKQEDEESGEVFWRKWRTWQVAEAVELGYGEDQVFVALLTQESGGKVTRDLTVANGRNKRK